MQGDLQGTGSLDARLVASFFGDQGYLISF